MTGAAAGARPVVSVIVPMLDEQADIAACIDRLAGQTYGVDALQLVLVDAASCDDTVRVAVAAAQAARLDYVVCDNPRRRTSIGLNVGLEAARGRYVVRADARSRIQPDHVERCVANLRDRPDVGVAGGAQIATARNGGCRARAIARALNNRWLMGLARYRRRGSSGPADTVWMGAFRTAELRSLGGWDEETALNEDYELNERYRASGALVWFDAELQSGYLPRATVALVARQYASFGRVKAHGWARGRRPAPRQLVLLAAPPVAVIAAAAGVVAVGIWPVVAVVAVVAIALDAASGAGNASPVVRMAALGVNAMIGASWWWGVTRGWLASRRGDRPQTAFAARSTR